MAAISANIDFSKLNLQSKFELLQNREYLLRPLAIETIPNMKDRIHKEGKASDGSQIGTYSSGYMRKREEAKRGESRQVIVSLTRQLENDWAVLPTTNGYGIGFNNPLNKDKAGWVEEGKGKIIFNLAAEEKQYITERLQELIHGAINS
jgi:hypothetical protein